MKASRTISVKQTANKQDVKLEDLDHYRGFTCTACKGTFAHDTRLQLEACPLCGGLGRKRVGMPLPRKQLTNKQRRKKQRIMDILKELHAQLAKVPNHEWLVEAEPTKSGITVSTNVNGKRHALTLPFDDAYALVGPASDARTKVSARIDDFTKQVKAAAGIIEADCTIKMA